jgi:hypothetical protein
MPAFDLNRAVDYVYRSSDKAAYAIVRLATLGAKPSDAETAQLLGAQTDDGGWPYLSRPGNPETVNDTLFALEQLLGLGMAGSKAVERGIRFVQKWQKGNGMFDENPALLKLHDVPFWMLPGDMKTQLFLTASAGFLIARVDAGDPAVAKATAYLQANQGPDGTFDSYLHTHWLALALFKMKLGKLAPSVQLLYNYIFSLDFADWPPSQLAWMLKDLAIAGYVPAEPLPERVIESLYSRQRMDGGFDSEEGAESAMPTVDAIVAYKLMRLG